MIFLTNNLNGNNRWNLKEHKIKNFIFKNDYNFYSILILCINFVIGL